MGTTHLPHLLRLSSEVLVYGGRAASQLVASHGGEQVATLDELLERVDVVDVATPTPTHAALVGRALEAGKHVIREKPLARSVEDAEALAALAVGAGRQLHVAHVVRYFPEYAGLHEAARSGQLGDISAQRFVRSGAHPIQSAWFTDRAASGGVVLDLMIHDLDVARWVAGDVVRVSAVSQTRSGSAGPMESAHVQLTHGSGAISVASGVWGPQHLAFTTSYSVVGTRGALHHDSFLEQNVRVELAGATAVEQFVPDVTSVGDPYLAELGEFVGAICGGPAPRITVDDAVAAVRIAEAAIESIEISQPVELRCG